MRSNQVPEVCTALMISPISGRPEVSWKKGEMDFRGFVLFLALLFVTSSLFAGPFDAQVSESIVGLESSEARIRYRSAERLGYLRSDAAESALLGVLRDDAAEVRRAAAMALGWCGTRLSLGPLTDALNDPDWTVRQAAHVSLSNLTGMEFVFNALGKLEERGRQAERWRQWLAGVPLNAAPREILESLQESLEEEPVYLAYAVQFSSVYKGSAEILFDGRLRTGHWQTKKVKTPQWVVVDLISSRVIDRVIVHQHSKPFVMAGWEVAVSADGKTYHSVGEDHGKSSPVQIEVQFPPQSIRYVRVSSFGGVNPTYPTTITELEILSPGERRADFLQDEPAEPEKIRYLWQRERAFRALGVFAPPDASRRIIQALGPSPAYSAAYSPTVQAGLRALGRLRQPDGFDYLVMLLERTDWARYAARALGEFGDPGAVGPLLDYYPEYAKLLNQKNPPNVPRDDVMGFPSFDRMLETPYYFSLALCRLGIDQPKDLARLRSLAPLIIANMPGNNDTYMLYELESHHHLTRHLLDVCGMRRAAREHTMRQLGVEFDSESIDDSLTWPPLEGWRIAPFLPAVCDETDQSRLLKILKEDNQNIDGWVRINAAKAIAHWGTVEESADELAEILRSLPSEADYGYSGTFKTDEYNDPTPRWREAVIRALGMLGAVDHVEMVVSILEDEHSTMEIRRAAALALIDLDRHTPCPDAMEALRRAAREHEFLSTQQTVRDVLHSRNERVRPTHPVAKPSEELARQQTPQSEHRAPAWQDINAIVFIQGTHILPNMLGSEAMGTVAHGDHWRMSYVIASPGPEYRPGRNLMVLSPPRPDGELRPLTKFAEGYVANPEVTWDGDNVLFSRRGGDDDPWWQIWKAKGDGSELAPLTKGPYHHVAPAELPDGRIVFSCSKVGTRDEYHGYACTALYVMNADGSGMHPIAMNIGRDNEPSILADGRIAFSRLEVFYSRNKTELTLHAARPDGSMDMVLYGPERRRFWRELDHGFRAPPDNSEVPLTHRVLRVSQPRVMPDGRKILTVTQAGLTLLDHRRDTETLLTPDFTRAYTTPFPLADGRILCASTLKEDNDPEKVDLGICLFDPQTGRLEPVYNDPAVADYEAKPLVSRCRPPILPTVGTPTAYSGRFFCASVYQTREPEVQMKGRYVRLIEAVPQIGRHSSHTSRSHKVWQNHGGTLGRVLGTAPLAADGSFYVETAANRLTHFQVLDSDRRVVGNQLTWMYTAGGETKSCVGCHEPIHATARAFDPLAAHESPIDFTPVGNEFTYRAKAWFKGSLPMAIEERTRTARSVNLIGQ